MRGGPVPVQSRELSVTKGLVKGEMARLAYFILRVTSSLFTTVHFHDPLHVSIVTTAFTVQP